jgi:hypothetical protein
MPEPWQHYTIIIAGVIATIFVAVALWRALRHSDPILLFALIGGLLAMVLEPICNVLGLAYHPEIGQVAAFEALGRKMPLHILLIYPWYFGTYIWLLFRYLDRGMGRSGFWKVFGASAALAFFIEIVPVHVGLWTYYGPQPFQISGMPLWWYVVNPTGVIGAASISYLAVGKLSGWQRWPIIVLVPIGAVAVHTGAAAPLYLGLNSSATAGQNIIPGLLTIAFAICELLVMQRLLFPNAQPQRSAMTPARVAQGAT